jgi:hypothetical protein
LKIVNSAAAPVNLRVACGCRAKCYLAHPLSPWSLRVHPQRQHSTSPKKSSLRVPAVLAGTKQSQRQFLRSTSTAPALFFPKEIVIARPAVLAGTKQSRLNNRSKSEIASLAALARNDGRILALREGRHHLSSRWSLSRAKRRSLSEATATEAISTPVFARPASLSSIL